jgi:hypothetical protein
VFEFKEFEKDGDILAMASRLNRATDSILFSFSAGEVEEVAEAANEDIV